MVPVAHITGSRAFGRLDLEVTPDVLVPRPDTEVVVDVVVELAPQGAAIADWGTGSGAIALSVADLRADVSVVALERSPEGAWADKSLAMLRSTNERLGIRNLEHGAPRVEKTPSADEPLDPYAETGSSSAGGAGDAPVDPYGASGAEDAGEDLVDPYADGGAGGSGMGRDAIGPPAGGAGVDMGPPSARLQVPYSFAAFLTNRAGMPEICESIVTNGTPPSSSPARICVSCGRRSAMAVAISRSSAGSDSKRYLSKYSLLTAPERSVNSPSRCDAA